jgi:cobaltochelatase CobT
LSKPAADTLSALKQAMVGTARALARRKREFAPPPFTSLPEPRELTTGRALLDRQALFLRFHNTALHRRHRPHDPASARLFDMLEQLRTEAAGSEGMAGVLHNLNELAHTQVRGIRQSGAALSLPQAVEWRARGIIGGQLLGMPLDDLLQPHANALAELEPVLARMASQCREQTLYAATALELIETLALISRAPEPDHGPAQESADDAPQSEGGQQPSGEQMPQAAGDETSADSGATQMARSLQESPTPTAHQQQVQAEEEATNAPFPHGHNRQSGNVPAYHTFTTQHDEIVVASALAPPQELEQLRGQLDARVEQFRSITARLASQLQRLLLAQQARRWMYDEEDGIIDNRKLARIITQPGYELIYKREQDTDFRDTVFTLLIDNSGSMRGRPITMAAICADILSRTLERCGVKTEILGFTTKEWKGGQSYKDWMKRGKPPKAGRLNDLRHIIYKSADMSWRKAHRNLGLMLKDGLLKENIDGEAILWACQRLLARPEQRRILMVISDGAPVDDSTLSANAGNYLDLHLREVIATVETHMPIELVAIGIGHDVTRYYKRAVTISDLEKLGETMTRQLTELFVQKKGK